ncbi:hypothetical protein DNI29_14445 [Hymenobacter sediminis]|uniref:carboxypeptidase-like regulatory domain-containing protein n=1 Tax=Hymenobacter sediminis TaxID=2218621 RepID=UPI000DA67E3A|nr:carboxypeptidase-like regulatory domain-containing protein [Hymenobacter sediminis]RPD46201.1 hypothetical protein DNI29_14445 [Hymenobacter sediminis]
MRRSLLLASISALFALPFATNAQSSRPATRPSSERIAMAAPAAATAPARLACSGKFVGQVLTAAGKPLTGATVLVDGSRFPVITNSEGRYIIEEPVYRGQVIHIAAAGYVERDVTLTTCESPIVELELAEGTRIKRTGKRAGQIVRLGQ